MSKPKESKTDRLLAFRAKHDKKFILPNKIREGLKALGDDWKYEDDFMKLIDVKTKNDIAPFRDMFKEFIVEIPTKSNRASMKIWAGTKAFASTLRATQS